jgi:hypothetical protein
MQKSPHALVKSLWPLTIGHLLAVLLMIRIHPRNAAWPRPVSRG